MPDLTQQITDWTRAGQSLGGMAPDGSDGINIPPLAAWIAWRIRDILEQLNKGKWKRLPAGQSGALAAPVAVLIGRAVAEEALRQAVAAEYAGTSKSAAAKFLGAFVDDYCGTPPRRKWPWPRGIDIVIGRPELLLIAGQLQAGATLGGGEPFATAAQKVARVAG